MSATPSVTRGRTSGIPTPGKSAIPTPGRIRSSSVASSVHQQPTTNSAAPDPTDQDFIQKAFADAIKANDPAAHRSSRVSDVSASSSSLSPSASISTYMSARPPSAASSAPAISPIPPKTPTYNKSNRPSYSRPPSRTSDAFVRSSSRAGRSFEMGDDVRIESLGYEGVLRFFGSNRWKTR